MYHRFCNRRFSCLQRGKRARRLEIVWVIEAGEDSGGGSSGDDQLQLIANLCVGAFDRANRDFDNVAAVAIDFANNPGLHCFIQRHDLMLLVDIDHVDRDRDVYKRQVLESSCYWRSLGAARWDWAT